MPYYSGDDEQMPDDMPEKPDGASDGEGQEDMGGETTMVPMSIFPNGAKPGETCSFTVKSVHGDEVEIQYAEEPSDDMPDKRQRFAQMADRQ